MEDRMLYDVALKTLFAVSMTASAWGQSPEVDRGEVDRRGNYVQIVEGARWLGDEVGQALAPPADDSGKWHITLIKQQGCPPCARLAADFETKEVLKAWVNTADHNKSWAKYNVFNAEDQSQSWRWKNISVRGYPVLIIQPPMDRKYGDPSTVVMQKTGYNGNAEALTREMRDAIIRYTEKIKHERAELVRPSYVWGQEIGVDPPFSPPPKIDPTVPSPSIPDFVNPDARTPQPGLPTQPTAYVLMSAKVQAGDRVEKFLERTRERIKNLATIVLPNDEAYKLFPSLDPANPPAVIVIDDGKVTEQVSVDGLPFDIDSLPWTDILTLIMSLITGSPISWVLVGGIGLKIFQSVRSKREAQGKRLWIPKALVDKVEEILNSNKT
jgi:hypothetical protein